MASRSLRSWKEVCSAEFPSSHALLDGVLLARSAHDPTAVLDGSRAALRPGSESRAHSSHRRAGPEHGSPSRPPRARPGPRSRPGSRAADVRGSKVEGSAPRRPRLGARLWTGPAAKAAGSKAQELMAATRRRPSTARARLTGSRPHGEGHRLNGPRPVQRAAERRRHWKKHRDLCGVCCDGNVSLLAK